MKRIFSSILFFFYLLFTGIPLCYAQKVWKDPLAEGFPVIEGRLNDHTDYSRMPFNLKDSVRKVVWDLSQQSAGLSFSFTTNSSKIQVEYLVIKPIQLAHMPATGASGVDLYVLDQAQQWKWIRGNFSFGDTIRYDFSWDQESAKEGKFTLFLPLYNQVKQLRIGIDSNSTFEFSPRPSQNPIVIYGTSIAQGACASRPGMAWTNILQRVLNQPIVNLGFSGNGMLEKEIIHFIGNEKASLFVLDCLPNLVSSKGLSDQEISGRILYAVQYLRQKHPKTPILLTAHAGYSDGEVDPLRKGMYLHINKLLEKEFNSLLSEGMEKIFLLEKEEIGLTEADFVDGTHPTDGGMLKYAQAYVQKILEINSSD